MSNRDIIEEINDDFLETGKDNIIINRSLIGIIEGAIKELGSSPASPNEYYYLKDLTNPQQKFWKNTSPNVKKSKALARKLVIGTQLHQKFANWCKELPGFLYEEVRLDGAYVGIPRVVGKVDYVVGDSIIELKTCEKLPLSIQDVITKHPHDLEQLVFYSALDPTKPAKNYLLFMESKDPFQIEVYEIETKNFDAIKSIIKERIGLLDKAFSSPAQEKEYQDLGRCRYFESGCEFNETGVCRCGKIQPLNTTKLLSSIEIRSSPDFKKQLESTRKDMALISSLGIFQITLLPHANIS